MAKTWRVLEAEGVKRCCAMFRNGHRCRRRAEPSASWCAVHGPVMQAHEDHYKQVCAQMARSEETESNL